MKEAAKRKDFLLLFDFFARLTNLVVSFLFLSDCDWKSMAHFRDDNERRIISSLEQSFSDVGVKRQHYPSLLGNCSGLTKYSSIPLRLLSVPAKSDMLFTKFIPFHIHNIIQTL